MNIRTCYAPFVAVMLAGAVAVLAASTNKPAAVDTNLGPEFQQAVRLLDEGRDRDAEPLLRHIQQRHPNHPTVRHLLQQIEARRARDTGAALRSQLQRLIVPELNTRNAAPADVVDFLRAESAKLTPDGQPVNIVVLLPPDAKPRGITLSLKNIPLLDALRFAAQAAGLEMKVEKHAVILAPPSPAAPAESPAHAEP